MAGLGRVVVGYRSNDRRRHLIEREYGYGSALAGRCEGCGHPVWYTRSGQDAIRNRDAALVCTVCYEHDKDAVIAAL